MPAISGSTPSIGAACDDWWCFASARFANFSCRRSARALSRWRFAAVIFLLRAISSVAFYGSGTPLHAKPIARRDIGKRVRDCVPNEKSRPGPGTLRTMRCGVSACTAV